MKRITALLTALALIFGLCACSKKNELSTWQEQYDLGVRYLSEGNYEEAVIAFTVAIEIDPKQTDAYLERAAAYIEIGELDLAIADCETAISIEDTNDEIYIRIAELFESVGRPDLAKEFLQQGFEKTASEEIRERLDALAKENREPLGDSTEDLLGITRISFAESAITAEPFMTSSGIELYPFPKEAYGWVQSHTADIDQDGQAELISLFSTSEGISIQQHEVSEANGAVFGKELGLLPAPEYCDQMDVMLFYSAALGRYCIAVSSVPEGAYTGVQSFSAWLYTIEEDSIKQYQTWDWNNMIYGWSDLDAIQGEMSDTGWPYMENRYLSIYNEESMRSCVWLLKTEVVITDGMMPTEYVQYLRFLSPNELAALSNFEE